MFDKLLLLAEGGYMVYSGPITRNLPPAAVDLSQKKDAAIVTSEPVLSNWLNELRVPCPSGFNLADYLSNYLAKRVCTNSNSRLNENWRH